MCLFDAQGLPRWPDPGKIAPKSRDPGGVQRGKSGSLGVRGKRVRAGGGGLGCDCGPPLPLGRSGRSGRARCLHDRAGVKVWFSEQNPSSRMEVSGSREAHVHTGTLERGGMRIYLVSHLARGPRRLRILTLAPQWLACRLIGTRCGKDGRTDGRQARFTGLRLYFPNESIWAMWFH